MVAISSTKARVIKSRKQGASFRSPNKRENGLTARGGELECMKCLIFKIQVVFQVGLVGCNIYNGATG
ncbi:hypothetical protein L1987_13068 [Smallanthus sonchifolius]|uniref:Uncharacterized protein n=1 Tax=Smallanthus sonchifolius TaxID=185202 RepID=A0ACB9JHV2_9ASTR|nr:hypothetical protein L1987_13068 [Smallanthus sonchifolius]